MPSTRHEMTCPRRSVLNLFIDPTVRLGCNGERSVSVTKGQSVAEIEDPNELTEEQRATLAGRAAVRIFERMHRLDTSFMQRLGEQITEQDQGRALSDMITFLANEIIALWGEVEALRRRPANGGHAETPIQ